LKILIIRKQRNSLEIYKGPLRIRASIPEEYREGSRDSYPVIQLNNKDANAAENFPENSLYTTKYTLWSFLPKFLYEQFRKATSIYFLLICIIVTIPPVSPFNPWTSWIGLIFILVVSAVREAYEDYLRLRADMRVNNTKFTKVQPGSGEHETVKSFEIGVGDLIYLSSEERIPVDMVVLATAKEDGTCFIETAQLDGETNLKLRKAAHNYTQSLIPQEIANLSGTVTADVPNHHLYQFKGSLEVKDFPEKISLDTNHLLLASSVLRNTEWVIGVCVYTGPESKVGLNLKLPPSKFSRLDHRLNMYILFIFCVKMFLVVMLTIINILFQGSAVAYFQSLVDTSVGPALSGLKIFVIYFALLSYLIPISLVVTLDIVRFIQAAFIQADQDMQHEGKKATAKTSNLNDELALVEHIFSDKTGTLTENIMIFQQASINGIVYEDNGEKGALVDLIEDSDNKKTEKFVRNYLYALALAHSCQLDEIEGTYKSASPDEEALCRAAQKNRFIFKSREGNKIHLTVRDREETWTLLVEMAFTSQRRRMSVIVKSPKGKFFLYTKGADSVISERLRKNKSNKTRLQKTSQDLHQFSMQGLRTLLLAYKELSEEEFQTFWTEYNDANNLIEEREEEVEIVCDKMERDLVLIGATAIEDSLQRGVPETIFNLRRAGIKLWVITGDKQETAINIGYSSNLISSEMDVVIINGTTSDMTEAIINDAIKEREQAQSKHYSIVIDGATLAFVLQDHRDIFLRLAMNCETAICNRVTPLQKAEVVDLIQKGYNCVSLAIGDGGNDVSMIQTAHIGIGIKGREGSQAARAADFAIPQFRHLEKLLLVHGRYSLLRNTKVIYHSVYKNAVIFLIIAWFSFFNGASGLPLYGDWIMTFYNIIFTSLPVFSVGIFEKDLPEKIIHKHPEAYQNLKRLNFWSLFRWVANAIFHSLIIYFACWAIFHLSQEVIYYQHPSGFRVFGAFVITVGFFIVLSKLLLETNYWVFWTAIVYILSLLGYFLWELIESYIIADQLNIFIYIISTPILWLTIILMIPTTLLTDVCLKYIHRQMYPKYWHILQEQFLLSPNKGDGNVLELNEDTRTEPLLPSTKIN